MMIPNLDFKEVCKISAPRMKQDLGIEDTKFTIHIRMKFQWICPRQQ